MENQVWISLVIGFLFLMLLLQWFTNNNLGHERDWYKAKVLTLMGGNPVTKDSRLSQEYMARNRE